MAEASTAIVLVPQEVTLGHGQTHSPMIPIFLPGPAPSLFKGEYVVRPAHSMGAASDVSMLSGILKTKYSWPRIWLE